jgi:hypothetical protein
MLAPSETGLPGAVGVGNRAMPSPAFPRARSVVVRQNSKRPASGPLERCNCEWGPINSSGGSRHGEEIHCGDCFAMVPEKSRPAPGWIRITGCPLHPERNRSFRDAETQLEQLPVDAGPSPRWVFSDHPKNQLAHFPADWFSSDRLSSSRDPTPVQSEAGPGPTNHGLREDEDQRSLPSRPCSVKSDPEQFVKDAEPRARSFGVERL